MVSQISIITPSFNQGRFIERTILSVLSQTGTRVEYIIVDGGSTDETLDIVRSYSQKYPTKLKWISEPDDGQADAINKGFHISTAPVIGWLNSDDIYYPEALKTVVGHFENDGAADVIYGDANHIGLHGDFIERYPTKDWDFKRLLESCFISQPAAFISRNCIRKFGILDKNYKFANDYEYWIRLGINGARIRYIPELLAATRLHNKCATLNYADRIHCEINEIMLFYFGRVPDIWISNFAHAWIHSKGIKEDKRIRFHLGIIVAAIYASFKWNKRLSKAGIATIFQWCANLTAGSILKRLQ